MRRWPWSVCLAAASTLASGAGVQAQDPAQQGTGSQASETGAAVQAEEDGTDAADPPEVLPTRFARRPLTLPSGAVRLDATFGITSQDRDTLDRQTFVSFLGVVGFGATDDVEIGLMALPLQISPDAFFRDPGLYGLFRIVASEAIDVGVQLEATVPVRAASAFGNALSLVALWRPASFLRVDAAVTLVAFYRDPVETGLRLPLVASFQLGDRLFVGVQTGLDVQYLSGADEAAGREHDVLVPAGLFLGGTLQGERGPTGDLRIGVLLPSVADGLSTWQLGFGGSFYVL